MQPVERTPIPMSDEEKAQRKAEIEANQAQMQAMADASKRSSEAAVQPPKPLGPNAITEVPEELRPQAPEQPTTEPKQVIDKVPGFETDQPDNRQ